LKQSVINYIQSCENYQQAKGEHVKLPWLLQPLPIPTRAWTIVRMYFVEGLPKSDGTDVILVLINKLTKYGYFFLTTISSIYCSTSGQIIFQQFLSVAWLASSYHFR
jgi:hypothetical protein